MEAVCSSKKLVRLYRTKGCHIPFDWPYVCPKCQKWKNCNKVLNTLVDQNLIIFMVITVHQWYQSLYNPTNAQRKIRRVN